MKKTILRCTESDIRNMIREMVEQVLTESDAFLPTGYRTVSNAGGHEVQISPRGDAARFRFFGGEPTDWMEIEFDEEGIPYVETERGRELLSDYMRYQ